MKQLEEWRPIPGFPKYEASTQGQIRSLYGKRSKILKPGINRDGYLHVGLHLNKVQKTWMVHVLVALTFIGERPEGQCIRHLDGNPANNHPSNLCYGSLAENSNDRKHTGARGWKLNPRKVRVIRGLFNCGFTKQRLLQLFGISRVHLNRILSERMWSNL